jgi:hypothetical protein
MSRNKYPEFKRDMKLTEKQAEEFASFFITDWPPANSASKRWSENKLMELLSEEAKDAFPKAVSVDPEIEKAIRDVTSNRGYDEEACKFYKNVSDSLFCTFKHAMLPINEFNANINPIPVIGCTTTLSNPRSDADHGTGDWWD